MMPRDIKYEVVEPHGNRVYYDGKYWEVEIKVGDDLYEPYDGYIEKEDALAVAKGVRKL